MPASVELASINKTKFGNLPETIKSMRRSLVNLLEVLKDVTKVVTGCLRMTKDTIFAVF